MVYIDPRKPRRLGDKGRAAKARAERRAQEVPRLFVSSRKGQEAAAVEAVHGRDAQPRHLCVTDQSLD